MFLSVAWLPLFFFFGFSGFYISSVVAFELSQLLGMGFDFE